VSDHGSYRHGKTTLHDYGMRVPMLCQWTGTVEPSAKFDGLVANIDFTPTILDLCGIIPPDDYHMDGISFKAVLLGSRSPLRQVLFGEMGHARAVKTKDWKYIAVRYPEDVQQRIDRGEKFPAFEDHPPLDRPYLTRNGHLGYYASKVNPHYFEADQLYDLRNDPEEHNNVFEQNPDVAKRMKKQLAKALRSFENRPFGEFTD
jgi:arylsulfatase A-like enzyme